MTSLSSFPSRIQRFALTLSNGDVVRIRGRRDCGQLMIEGTGVCSAYAVHVRQKSRELQECSSHPVCPTLRLASSMLHLRRSDMYSCSTTHNTQTFLRFPSCPSSAAAEVNHLSPQELSAHHGEKAGG